MRRLRLATSLLAAGLGASALPAQAPRLSLAEAFREADRMAFPNRGAAGRTAEQAGTATRALRGVAPTLRVQTSYTRTTDPLGVFGMRLQEGVVTSADFDPARLNDPAATGIYGAAVVIEQPIVNVDALFGRRAAARARDAARASEQWTRESTRVDVGRAYYGAVLAQERVAALDSDFHPLKLIRGLEHMTDLVQSQVKAVLDAYAAHDVPAAMVVWKGDEEVDAICTSLFRELLTYMMEDPRNIGFCIHLMFCAKNIERIGDHATNIAETVFYMIEGQPIGASRPKGDMTSFSSTSSVG